jgi:hypothetical protein
LVSNSQTFFFLYKWLFFTYINMLKVTRGQSNSVVFTLTEKTTLSSPYFLVVFNNLATNELVYAICPDTSTQTTRYNLLTIIESNTSIPLSGQVKLVEGIYQYKVYEQTSSSNLDPSLSTSLVETGLLKSVTTATSSFIDNTYTEEFVWQN